MSKTKLTIENLEDKKLFAADLAVADLEAAPLVEHYSTDALESHAVAELDQSQLSAGASAETIEPIADSEAVDQVFAAGDANRDGVFDQDDVVQILSHGKYLSGQAAGWSQGDFTGDGRFDQQDIVAALQSGSYAQQTFDFWTNIGMFVWRGGW